MPKLTDAELVAAVEQEERQSIDTHSGELHRERTDALARYRGELLGNEIDGRSQIVDMTILDTIESIMPSLVSTFLGADNSIGEFMPVGPEDEDAAEAETDAVNWNLTQKNDLFSQVNATLRDALLLKNGYMVAYWQSKVDTMCETYQGLADEELAMLMQDQEVTVTEHSDYPDPLWQPPPPEILQQMQMQAQQTGQPFQQPQAPTLHDVKVERKKAEEFVAVESIPPDELLVSRRHRWTSVLDADFVQWRRRVSIGQLRAEGFDVPDNMPAEEEFTQEWAERQRFNEALDYNDETPDPSRRMVIFKDTYIRINLDYSPIDKGIPKLWRVCVINGSKQVILKEEADIIPFAAFSPIIYPHSHIGSSIYDQVKDLGLGKTVLTRQFFDGAYMQTNGQKIVNVDNCPNLDDFLVSRVGGIMRVNGDPSQAVFFPQIPDNGPSILSALQYMDDMVTRRTGVQTNAPNGMDPNSLNNSVTATAVQSASSQAAERTKLIAMTLVSGFKDLFLITHSLLCKHSTKPLQMKLNNKWAIVNPREWTRRTDFKINVGLGTGSPQMKMGALQAMMPVMQAAQQMGLAGPEEAYNYGCEMWKAAGYPVYERFLHPPPTGPDGKPQMPPPQPPPEVQVEQMRGQTAVQIAQAKNQGDMQSAQMHAQIQQSAEQARTQADVTIQQHKIQTDSQIELEKAKLQMAMDDQKHNRDMQTQLAIANINAAAKIEVARITALIANGQAMVEAQMAAAQEPMSAQ